MRTSGLEGSFQELYMILLQKKRGGMPTHIPSIALVKTAALGTTIKIYFPVLRGAGPFDFFL